MVYQVRETIRAAQSAQKAEQSLTDLYYKWFDVVRCDTKELIKKSQQLRYQVYCLETGFEDPAANSDGLEKDESDDHALHSLLIHRPSGMVAGTVRLIYPDHQRPHLGLPSYRVSPILTDGTDLDLPRDQTAEISRFSVSKAFRQRMDDGLYSTEVNDNTPEFLGRRALPSITLGLMRAIVEMTRDAGMTHVTAVVEPALIRLLGKLGIRFDRTGETVNYHGIRYPVYRDMSELLAGIYRQKPEIWHAITDGGRVWPLTAAQTRLLA
jgi:N-acyl amino acid synthase of PEP-CTERM/exosortase system